MSISIDISKKEVIFSLEVISKLEKIVNEVSGIREEFLSKLINYYDLKIDENGYFTIKNFLKK